MVDSILMEISTTAPVMAPPIAASVPAESSPWGPAISSTPEKPMAAAMARSQPIRSPRIRKASGSAQSGRACMMATASASGSHRIASICRKKPTSPAQIRNACAPGRRVRRSAPPCRRIQGSMMRTVSTPRAKGISGTGRPSCIAARKQAPMPAKNRQQSSIRPIPASAPDGSRRGGGAGGMVITGQCGAVSRLPQACQANSVRPTMSAQLCQPNSVSGEAAGRGGAGCRRAGHRRAGPRRAGRRCAAAARRRFPPRFP